MVQEQNNFQKLASLNKSKEFIDFACQCGLSREDGDYIEKVISDMLEAAKKIGKTPSLGISTATIGKEFIHSVLIKLKWEENDDDGIGFALGFDEKCEKIVHVQFITQEQMTYASRHPTSLN